MNKRRGFNKNWWSFNDLKREVLDYPRLWPQATDENLAYLAMAEKAMDRSDVSKDTDIAWEYFFDKVYKKKEAYGNAWTPAIANEVVEEVVAGQLEDLRMVLW